MLNTEKRDEPSCDAVPAELRRVKEQLQQGEVSPEESVRTLLSWFNAHRRGFLVVNSIREALESLALETYPDFDSAFIDATVRFENESDTSDSYSEANSQGASESGKANDFVKERKTALREIAVLCL